jgi:Spy/CpxP family protein refolding chaperone
MDRGLADLAADRDQAAQERDISYAESSIDRVQDQREPRRYGMRFLSRFLSFMKAGLGGAALIVATASVLAQSHQPYAGLEGRAVKALSDQQVADLRAGRGMSLALAAELNGYPGPMHVLELADSLGLSDQQRATVQDLFAAMKAEAIPLGEQLIAQETELDRQFAQKTITPASLKAATQAIGITQAALRETHLKYHLATVEVLTPAQVRHYGALRGYKGGAHRPGRH